MIDNPITRKEKYLAKLTGSYTGNVPDPITRVEKYLYDLCQKGISGLTPEEIENAVNKYLKENPIQPGATEEQAQQIKKNTDDVASLKEDISTKITKFYASSQGETHLADSDNGKIQDMMVYGRSEQKQYSGKNLLNPILGTTTRNGVTCTANGDGTYTLNGTATATDVFVLHPNIDFTGQMRLCGGTSSVFLQYSNSSNFAYEDKGAGIIIEHFDSVTYPDASFNILIKTDNVYNNALVKPMFTADLAATYDDFEPYTGGIPSPNPDYPQEIKSVVNPTVKLSNEDETQFKTLTLPYTLNAIPVSSGGNVTIGGQQYIADYVDVERGKLVKMVDSSKLDNTQSIIGKIEWLLAEPQEIDLTQEEVYALKALATYYPTTSISVNSEQLDGYTVFNYPISMANIITSLKTKTENLESANYTDRGTLADTDAFLINDGTEMKKSVLSKLSDFVLNKIADKVFAKLQTNDKTILGAINELNSNTRFDVTAPNNVSIINNASIKVGRVVYIAVKLKIVGALSSETILSFLSNATNSSTTFSIGKGTEWDISSVVYGYIGRNSIVINGKNAVSTGDYLHVSTVLIL